MCVIIDKPAGITMPDANVRAAAEANDDGWGVMWINPSDGKLKTKKGLFSSPLKAGEEFLRIYKQFKNFHAIFHLRVRTHGSVSVDNCHPFRICNEEEHGMDLCFMHNGSITCVDERVNPLNKSDTNFFNDQFLQPVLQPNPEAVFLAPMQTMIDGVIGNSRLLFLSGDGRIVRIGTWHEYEGHIVSNLHSFRVSEPVTHWWEKEEAWYDKHFPVYSTYRDTPPAPLALCSPPASTETTLRVLSETIPQQTRAEEIATQVKMNFNSAKEDTNQPEVSKPEVVEETGEVREMPYDDWIKTSDVSDMIPVGHRAVKAEYLTTDDLLQMESEDIYDFVYDFPERTHELVVELLSFIEYYNSGIHSFNKGVN